MREGGRPGCLDPKPFLELTKVVTALCPWAAWPGGSSDPGTRPRPTRPHCPISREQSVVLHTVLWALQVVVVTQLGTLVGSGQVSRCKANTGGGVERDRSGRPRTSQAL